MIEIILPWPSRDLHPNARVHWARKAKAAKQARMLAGWCAKEAGIRACDPDIPGAIRVTAIFYPPDKRTRDIDGMLSSIKSYCDGIADVIGIDDSKWQWGGLHRCVSIKGGSVRIELDAA